MFLNPVCLFWPSQLCASSRYCVAADEWVKNVLWDFSKRAVFKKTVALVSRAQQAHAWLTEYQPTSPSASAVFFRYKSFDFLAVSQVSSKLSRLSYGPVSVFFPSSSIWQNPLRTTALLQNDWLQPLLFGNVETARGDPSFAAAQSFDVAVISLRVVRVLRRTKRHHLRPPSPSCDGEFK